MADTIIDVDGTRLHYVLDGPAGAPVLVLSNSLGTDLSMWDRQIASFAREFRVLRYDARGHGGSASGSGACTVDRLGRDVLGLLDGLAIDRAHFCGVSMGGMTGMWLGVHAPERVRKLALCNTAAQIGPPERWNTRIAAVRSGGMAAIAQGVMNVWFTPAFAAREPDVVAGMRRKMEQVPPAGYIACCEAVRDADLRDAIAAIGAPTLVIAGTHDAATPPADGRFVAGRIHGASYVELDAAHLSNIEDGPRFTAAVVEFLRA